MYPIQEIDDLTLAFATNVEHLMPAYADIPADFCRMSNKWNRIFRRWFASGLSEKAEFVPKPGVDAAKALRHIGAVMRSYEPQHEHKEAAVAFLLSEWFDDVRLGDEAA